MRITASADLLQTTGADGMHSKRLRDDLFVGLDGSEANLGITVFAPALRHESYETRRQEIGRASCRERV